MKITVDEILSFWFADSVNDKQSREQQAKLWWAKDPNFDRQIEKRFLRAVQRASNSELGEWDKTPSGLMAKILLLDQLTRNIYRNTPQAFEHDAQALRLAQQGISQSFDRQLPAIYRGFFYLPFEHAEDMAMQKRSLELFGELLQEADLADKEYFKKLYNYALAHHRIIERFGRYPHRNAILGRDSTADEKRFLEEPGSSF